jgi:serine protease AprX
MAYRYSTLLLFLAFSSICFSQDSASYYFIYLRDKPMDSYSLDRPQEFLSKEALDRRMRRGGIIDIADVPVYRPYLEQVAKIEGVRIINKSRWMNAIEVKTDGTRSVAELKALSFVANISFLGRIRNRTKPGIDKIDNAYYEEARALASEKKDSMPKGPSEEAYGKSLVQDRMIGIPGLHQYSLGKHMHIAVLDAGFFNAYRVKGMQDLLMPEMIIRDYVDYDNSVWEDDRHGANVLGFMKTWNPGTYIGSAPMARYTLIRTENASSEYPTEEVNWLLAAEFADSLGVDMIVSSLGYHTFDDPSLNHTYAQLDGKTSIVAKAANMAFARGILLVTSVGNEGNGRWRRIGTPSDAPSIIGIGACDENGFRAQFSSVGPSADKRVKPDFLTMGYKAVVASPNGIYNGNGTSYSTPIFGGAIACLVQACPERSFSEIRQALQLSATHRSDPDSLYGYGLPDFTLALHILGKYNTADTMSDLFYTKSGPVFFQDLGIHFRSRTSQKVRITVKGMRRNKLRSVHKETYRLNPGEWIHEDVLFTIYKKESRKKSKNKLQSLVLVMETENGTIQKTIRLSYD